MTPGPSNLRGIVLMIAAAAAFVVNDSFIKLATEEMPPLQVLFLRGIAATAWCLPLVLLTGGGPKLRLMADRFVLLRNLFEIACVFCFVIALAQLPIADITAIAQLAPMLLMVGAAAFLGEVLGPVRWLLIVIGFAGAVLVAQPTGAQFSAYSLLGFGTALFMAARDLAGRGVPAAVPGPVVAFCAILMVMAAAGVATALFEDWVPPSPRVLLMMAGAGFFLMFGHLFIFLAYRFATVGAVAPFLYFFTIWAVVAGLVVFGELPNAPAGLGIALIVVSGVATVLLDERRRRLAMMA